VFWSDKETNLLQGDNDDGFRRARANEMRELFSFQSVDKVLEIGCGDGTLFSYLWGPRTDYKGIDFSPQFIEKFRAKYPAAKLECKEGASYQDGNLYDLIFLDGVLQHFDRGMLEQHLRNACFMMGDGGCLIWGSIPRRCLRMQYDLGRFGATKPSLVCLAKSWLARLLGRDAMGYWYEPAEIETLARKYGLRTKIVASSMFPYRFHAVLSKTAKPVGATVPIHGFSAEIKLKAGNGQSIPAAAWKSRLR